MVLVLVSLWEEVVLLLPLLLLTELKNRDYRMVGRVAARSISMMVLGRGRRGRSPGEEIVVFIAALFFGRHLSFTLTKFARRQRASATKEIRESKSERRGLKFFKNPNIRAKGSFLWDGHAPGERNEIEQARP
jgi:hypothetical protein